MPYPGGGLARYQWVYDQRVVELRDDREARSMAARAVLLALVHFDGPKGLVFPSIALLADMANCSARTVNEALAWLERHGWIVREQRHHRGRRTSNVYSIQQAETANAPDVLSAKSAFGPSAKSA